MRKRFGSASVTAVSSVFVSAFYGAARHALDIVFLHEHKEQHDGYGDDDRACGERSEVSTLSARFEQFEKPDRNGVILAVRAHDDLCEDEIGPR